MSIFLSPRSRGLRSAAPVSRPIAAAILVLGVATFSRNSAADEFFAAPVTLFGPDVDRASGLPDYVHYRIPAVVRAMDGTLVAVAEGRMADGPDDSGNIDVVYRRSTDNGVTWSDIGRIWSKDLPAPPCSVDYCPSGNTAGNPTLLLQTHGAFPGRIWLMMNWHRGDKEMKKRDGFTAEQWLQDQRSLRPFVPGGDTNHRRFYLTWSDDEGATWAPPVNITGFVYRFERPCEAGEDPAAVPCSETYRWDSYHDGVGPGLGVQLQRPGASQGMLVFPAYGRNIYCSGDDDCTQPSNWSVDFVPGGEGVVPITSESSVVELANGDLLRNDRPVKTSMRCTLRNWLTSGTLGGTWNAYAANDDLLAPSWKYDGNQTYSDSGCLLTGAEQRARGIRRVHSSMLRYTMSSPERIFHANLASTVKRRYPTIRISYDGGQTWPIGRRLMEDYAGYTALVKTADFKTGILVENGYGAARRKIWWIRVNLDWILNGQPEPAP